VTDLRPSLDAAVGAFGVTATVTPPGGPTITAAVIVLPDRPIIAGEEGMQVTEHHRVICVRRSQVPTVPQGTAIVVMAGVDAGSYSVDRIELQNSDEIRALVAKAA
jgi:hypothetical protein